jgi:hypothetical protein
MNEERLDDYIERVNARRHAFQRIMREFNGYAYIRRIRPGDTPDDHPFNNRLPWFVFSSRDARRALRFSTHANAIKWVDEQVRR